MIANSAPSLTATAVLQQGVHEPPRQGQAAKPHQATGNSHDFERSIRAYRKAAAERKAAKSSRPDGKNLPPGEAAHRGKASRPKHMQRPSSPGPSVFAGLQPLSNQPRNVGVDAAKRGEGRTHIAPKARKAASELKSAPQQLKREPGAPGSEALHISATNDIARSPVRSGGDAVPGQADFALTAHVAKRVAAHNAKGNDGLKLATFHSTRELNAGKANGAESPSPGKATAGNETRHPVPELESVSNIASTPRLVRSVEALAMMQNTQRAGVLHAGGDLASRKPSEVRKDTPGSNPAGEAGSLFGLSALQQQIYSVQPEGALSPAGNPALPPHDLSAQLTQHMAVMLAQGKHNALLQLSPPQLGTIHVHLRTEQQTVNAVFVSAHPDVRHALEASMPSLQQALAQQGLSLAGGFVADHGREGFSGRESGSYQFAPRRLSAGLAELDPLSGNPAEVVGAPRYISRGVSIYV